jgi:hypothetical protein
MASPHTLWYCETCIQICRIHHHPPLFRSGVICQMCHDCLSRPCSVGYMESTIQILYSDFIIKAMAQRNRIWEI